MTKKPIDIEKLLQWAYSELGKRQLSASEEVWQRWERVGGQGGVAVDEPQAPQRYAFVGEPHPDADAVAEAVRALKPFEFETIDWDASKSNLLGELLPWAEAWVDWRKSLAKCDEHGRFDNLEKLGNPFVGMGVINVAERLHHHAVLGRRPDWERDAPHASRLTRNGTGYPITLHVDREGRYCMGGNPGHRKGQDIRPMVWWPAPQTIIRARVEYVVWWLALGELRESLNAGDGLSVHVVDGPGAPEQPWINNQERMVRVFQDDTVIRAYRERLLPKQRRKTGAAAGAAA